MNKEENTEPQVPLAPAPAPKLSVPMAIIVGGALIAIAILINGARTAKQIQPTRAVQQQPPVAVNIKNIKTEGGPFIGSVNAPVTIAYWFDYQCPFCKQNEETTMPQLIKDYVDTGKVKVVFKDYEFLGADSQTLGQYARAVWAVAPDKFYDWHKAIYDNQGKENTGWATKEKIISLTTQALGAADTAKVSQAIIANSAVYQSTMDADKAEGSTMGVQGTPAFIIGTKLVVGAEPYSVIKQAIDATLGGN